MDISYDEIWIAVGQILSGLALGLGAFFLNKLKSWKANRFRHILNKNLRVKDLLTEIKVFYDADRVELFQFHNGDYYMSKASIQKLSLTHFVVGRGVAISEGIDTNYQNIPLGYIGKSINQLATEHPYIFSKISDFAEDNYLGGLFRLNGASSILLRGIFRKDDMIGILAVTWLEEVELNSEQIHMIKPFSDQMADEISFGR